MMSVTAIIQGAQAQHWGRSLAGLGPPHIPLGIYLFNFPYIGFQKYSSISRYEYSCFDISIEYYSIL